MGKKPTHPELLDWLAATFVESGWSIKSLHRRIVCSDTYARSSDHPDWRAVAEKDATGTSYAVFRPRRLSAEELRDSMLAVSGELNRAVGGIPARPEMNLEAALQPRQVMGTFASAWQPSPRSADRHRRSLYALHIRGLRDPLMEVFNQPSPDLSCEARESSTVTPQVFSLFHSDSSWDRAIACAHALLAESTSTQDAVRRLYMRALGRPATPEELEQAVAHWDRMTEQHQVAGPPKRTSVPSEIEREAVEENTGEKFRFTERLEMYADFQPDLKSADVDARTRGLADLCLVLFNANEFVYVY